MRLPATTRRLRFLRRLRWGSKHTYIIIDNAAAVKRGGVVLVWGRACAFFGGDFRIAGVSDVRQPLAVLPPYGCPCRAVQTRPKPGNDRGVGNGVQAAFPLLIPPPYENPKGLRNECRGGYQPPAPVGNHRDVFGRILSCPTFPTPTRQSP